MDEKKYRVAGYAKLAKLWERSREKAIQYHNEYYESKYVGVNQYQLVGVYIDITGHKEIRKRPEMIRLLRDCIFEKVDLIAVQTKAYLAANLEELCYLMKLLSEMPQRVDIISEDEDCQIDTVLNPDNQREAFLEMTDKFIFLNPGAYGSWKAEIKKEIANYDAGV